MRRKFSIPFAALTAIISVVVIILLVVINQGRVQKKLAGAPTFSKEASIPLRVDQGLGPLTIDIDPANEFAYVTVPKGNCFAAQAASNISIIGKIRLSDGQLVDKIALPNWVLDAKVTPDGKFLYVTNSYEDYISVLDLKTNEVIARTPAGSNPTTADTKTCRTNFNYKPMFLAFSQDGKFAYAVNGRGNGVTVIDTKTHKFVKQIPVTKQQTLLYGITAHPTRNLLYISSKIPGSIFVIDTQKNKLVDEFEIENLSAFGLGVPPDGETLWVTNGRNGPAKLADRPADSAGGQVLILDPISGRVRDKILFAKSDGVPEWVTFDHQGKYAYITHYGTSKISIIDVATHEIVSSIQAKGSPLMATPDPSGKKLFLGAREGKSVEIFKIQ